MKTRVQSSPCQPWTVAECLAQAGHVDKTFKERAMLHYAVVFLVIALIAAVFGFGGIAAGAVGIAKVLFFVFIIMAIASFLFGLIKK